MILNADQLSLQKIARQFAREKLLPTYIQRDREFVLDRGLLRAMGEAGLLGRDLPREYGGHAIDAVTMGVMVEEIAYGDFNFAGLAVVQSLCNAVIVRNAGAEIKDYWLPRVTRGESVFAIAVTEQHAGSDAGSIKLSAKREGESYILNGEKASVTFSNSADAFLIFARTGDEASAARGVTAFLVPRDIPGLSHAQYDNLGAHMSGRGSLFFSNVRLSATHRIGEEGQAFTEVMKGFDYSRALIALQCIGATQASLDEAWGYTQEREAFGGPIARFQGVTFPLVEGEAQMAAGRQLAYHTLQLRDAGEPHTLEAALVKSFIPTAAFDTLHRCLLTFGHYGCSMASPHQQRMRDVMGLEIGDGTPGILKMIVARKRTGRAASGR
jgi:cyclohexanecarboxyl-CoA dehydrogenase